MRRLLGGSLFLLLLLGVAVPGSAADQPTVRVFIRSDAEARVAALGITPRHRFAAGFSADVPAVMLDRLTLDMGGQMEVVGTVRVLGGRDGSGSQAKPGTAGKAVPPEDQTPWGIESVYNDQAITATSGGDGIIVAVLDTGVNKHNDLREPVQCKDFSGAVPVKDGSCRDGNGHGTHVTGTVAAMGGKDGSGIYGVAPQVGYFAYKVLNNAGSGSWDDVAAAIRTAADNGAHIISMSLGGSTAPEFVREAVQYAGGKGTLVIAAAGNSGPGTNTIGYPGGYAEVVAVAALEMVLGAEGSGDSTGQGNLRIASFSSRGAADSDGADGIQDREVELAAPGRSVESTANDGGYAKFSGTSMATPHIAGLAAKMWQGSATATRQWLVQAAGGYDITQDSGGGTGSGYDLASGYGQPRIN